MKLRYVEDLSGNELLEDEDGIHQIMMEWEKPYMERCIELLDPSGHVLEIGFGLGYSANKICSYNIKSYTIIECSPVVWEKIEEFKTEMSISKPDISINVIKGRWQDVLSCAKVYDSIFFDDYIGQTLSEDTHRFALFLYEVLIKHMNIGSQISVYSNSKTIIELDCISMNIHEYDIDIPTYCKYARGNKMYIPLIKKIGECEGNLKEKLLNKYLKLKDCSNKIVDLQSYLKKQSIYCNLLIIDNFYNNAIETRNFILTQDFKVRGNYPGQRTESYANEHLRDMIQGYIEHFAGKIIEWPTDKESYNGAFQYTTSRDRTWVHNDGWNNWAGIIYLTPNAPITSGTGIFRFKDGTRTVKESEVRDNKKLLDEYSQDYTKWELVDRVGNIFNRLVLFNANQYHASLDYFGTSKENSRLFQVFFFSTEK